MRLESARSRVPASGARLAISSSSVRLGSSRIAHSSPAPGDAPRLAVELVEAERARQPRRRVDRDHRDALAAGGAAERDRRRHRRLADAAGADADAQAPAERRSSGAHASDRQRVGEHVELGRAELGRGEQRQLDGVAAAARAGRAARGRARCLGERDGEGGRAARRRPGGRAAPRRARGVLRRRSAARATALASTASSSPPSSRAQVEQLVDRRLLGRRDGRHRGLARGRAASRR